MRLFCANGCHDGEGVQPFKTEGFDRQPHEKNCKCGGRLLTGMERNARKKNPIITLTCPDCGRDFERRANRRGTGKCTPCAQNRRPLRVVECLGCGETFETKEPEQSYCGQRCFRKHFRPTKDQLDKSAAIGRKRTGKKNPNFRHGRRISENERRLHREFNLGKKGERACRVCGSEQFPHAHHAVPRSLSRAGKYDLRNCLPLCARCHASWHRRGLTIYRDAFTEPEWEFMVTLINPGWLDERYPDRGRPLRDPECPARLRLECPSLESPERARAHGVGG